ncbi:Seryl-tRNA synthetase [hydrothermal vent metagenome]|uniref:Serine--tRNA ligase n=1 Tax=hydrothermal vent metagenome TaxID=652676 RepID=A0A1W1EKB9_9ZZZZ
MIDLKYLQKNYEEATAKLIKKGVDSKILDELNSLFLEHKEALKSFEDSKAEQNRLSKEFGTYKREGRDIAPLKAQIDELKVLISSKQDKARDIAERLENFALNIPNFPDDSVPNGESEDDNLELRKVLTPKEFSFTPKEHWELSEINGWIDFGRGVKLAKSRFSVLRGDGARLERALINFFLDENRAKGFEEVAVPFINNRDMLQGTGQLPKFEDDLFKIEDENLFLIPTAEVPLTNLYNDEILSADELPKLLTAYTPCFRKEAGSAGRDTRGMIRQHQFSKVEMVAIANPNNSEEIFKMMVNNASDILTKLGLPHRVVELCYGDLGFSASTTIDLEVWLPGQNRYREISSISNTREFQARRAKIRFKDGKKNSLVHTLNGSALAVGRTIVAIMENYQNEDGTVDIPEVLKKYM